MIQIKDIIDAMDTVDHTQKGYVGDYVTKLANGADIGPIRASILERLVRSKQLTHVQKQAIKM
jgi:hypothetical protein